MAGIYRIMKHIKLFEAFEEDSAASLSKGLERVRSRTAGAEGFIPTRDELLELQAKFKKMGWRTKMERSFFDIHGEINGVNYKYMTLRVFDHPHWNPKSPGGYQCIFRVSEPEELPAGYSGDEVKTRFIIEELPYYGSKLLTIAPEGYNPNVECPYKDLLENNPLNSPISKEVFDNELFNIISDRRRAFRQLKSEDLNKYLDYKSSKEKFHPTAIPAKDPKVARDTKKYDLEIDMANLPDALLNLEFFLEGLCSKHGLEISHMETKGPAGGFPAVTFRGDLASLESLLVDLEYPNDRDELKYLLSTAIPVDHS